MGNLLIQVNSEKPMRKDPGPKQLWKFTESLLNCMKNWFFLFQFEPFFLSPWLLNLVPKVINPVDTFSLANYWLNPFNSRKMGFISSIPLVSCQDWMIGIEMGPF